MSIHRKLTTVCCAAVLALGLAACGSSDNDKAESMTPTTTDPAGPTAEEMAAAAAAAAAEVVAKTKAAGTKRDALEVEAMEMGADDAGRGGTAANDITDVDAEGYYKLSIERDSMATTVAVTINGAADEDGVEFVQAMDLGHGRTMHLLEMEADEDGNVVEEVVIVATDIEPPKATKFATVYPLDVNPKTTDGDDNQSLEIDADNLAMIATAGITSTGQGEITVPMAVEDNDQTPMWMKLSRRSKPTPPSMAHQAN